jgi:regulator of protease activity HflC (stomatin/prohibitin superfamily)
MKKIIVLSIGAMALLGCFRVPPGHEGLKVNILGSDKGEIEQYPTGQYLMGINTEWFIFPTFNQNYVWTQDQAEGSPNDESFTFSIDGLAVNIDIGIEYSLNPEKIKDIFVTYRKGVDELTDVTIRNQVRDAFNTFSKDYDMDTLISGGMTQLVDQVEEYLKESFATKGILIQSISLVNAPRYPRTVQSAIEAKIEATQRAVQRENELREAKAEAEKKIAEAEGQAQSILALARAEAEANSIVARSITQNIIQMEWIKKWNGELPEVTSDANFMMDLTR